MSLSTSLTFSVGATFGTSVSPKLSPIINQFILSPKNKTPVNKSKDFKFPLSNSPFVEINNNIDNINNINNINNIDSINNIDKNSPIFKMSPLSLINFAQTVDLASSYGALTINKIELPQLPQLSVSISPPKVEILPLPSLSNKNSLYERRMKAKEKQYNN